MTVNLSNVGSGFKRSAINSNFTTIEDELNNNVLTKDGGTQLEADLDFNSNKAINLADGVGNTDAVTVQQLNAIIAGNEPLSSITQARESQLGSDAVARVFTLSGITYAVGVNTLSVYRNGQRLEKTIDYLETSSSTVTLTFDPNSGDRFVFITNDLSTSEVTTTSAITHSEGGVDYNLGTYLSYKEANTVSELTTFSPQVGDRIVTKGYYSAGDGGAATYLVAAPQAVDGYGDHTLANGNVALLQIEGAANARQFGCKGDDVNDSDAILAMWTYCLANGLDMYFPSGTYVRENASMPMGRIDGSPPSSLLDCKGITVFGDGPTTILKTVSANGADVIQVNGAKNFHCRDFNVEATLTGSGGAGSNGVSVTGGGDDITFTRITAKDLPYIDQTTFLDGGKGFTVQQSGFTPELGSISFIDCIADGCVYGFDYNPNMDDLVGEPCSITVKDGLAKNCWVGYTISSPAASAAISEGFTFGGEFSGHAVDCQISVLLGRSHGCKVDVKVNNSKSKADLKLGPNSTAWSATLNPDVESLICLYAHNSDISVTGFANNVDYKARIGGATQGSSGLSGATYQCKMYLDLGGTSDIADILEVNVGGNTLYGCELKVSSATATSIPSGLFTSTKRNQIIRLGEEADNLLRGSLQFPATQIANTDPNCLDDYEEGGFNPALYDTSLSDKGATYSLRYGRYQKIGERVFFNLYIQLSGLGSLTGSDQASIGGLPYTSTNIAGNIAGCSVGFTSGIALSAAGSVNARVGSNSAHVTLSKVLATSSTGDTSMTVNEVSASGLLVISGDYLAA